MSTPTVLAHDSAVTGRAATLPLVAVGAVIAAALAALVMSLFRGEATIEAPFDNAVTAIGGAPLVELPDEGADPAVGLPAPTLRGEAPDGTGVRVPTTGRPTVVLFVAHWCPHCQAEVPVVQQWVDAGRQPDGVDLVGVATAMDPTRPNYPTSDWLDAESWTSPIVADGDNHAAFAYGLSAFPFWVSVGADGKVVERISGELNPQEIDALFARAAAGATVGPASGTPGV